MEVWIFGLVVLVVLAGLIWLAVYLSEDKGELKQEVKELTLEQELIEYNKQKRWANENLINTSSDNDINSMLDKWRKK